MADIPARIAGDYKLLLERLAEGVAGVSDQKWAAEILRESRVPVKVSGQRVREANRRLSIYLDVLHEVGKPPHSLESAFDAVAARHRAAREYDEGRELTPKTVANIFYAERAVQTAAEAWWEEHRDEDE